MTRLTADEARQRVRKGEAYFVVDLLFEVERLEAALEERPEPREGMGIETWQGAPLRPGAAVTRLTDARRHAETATADLQNQAGGLTQGLTNWLPTLADDVRALAAEVERLEAIETAATEFVGHFKTQQIAWHDLFRNLMAALRSGREQP